MTVPGAHPKIGVVSVGHDGVHGGHGYKDAVVDDYPIRFGLRSMKKPDDTKVPPVTRPGAKYGRRP